jgi:hypothetical protein
MAGFLTSSSQTISPTSRILNNIFPHVGDNNSSTDMTISTNTTINPTDYQLGFLKCNKLTINAGITLKVNKAPFMIICQELNFGDTSSCIDASGLDGSLAVDNAQAFNCQQAWGGMSDYVINAGAKNVGGCGGGFLILFADKITGAAGQIKANGGKGWSNNTVNSSGAGSAGGQGALSTSKSKVSISGNPEQFNYMLDGAPIGTPSSYIVNNLSFLLKPKNASSISTAASGGGSGKGQASAVTGSTGGSGIGHGGNMYAIPPTNPDVRPNLYQMISLYKMGCTGGGGGFAAADANIGNCAAGGVGGGAIIIFASTFTVTPTLSVTAGTGYTNGASSGVYAGSDGLTYTVQL